MNLRKLLSMLKGEVLVRVGTAEGEGWLANDTVENIKLDEKFMEREVFSTYGTEGREGNERCCKLEPAFAIVIEGDERGTI